MKRTGFFIFFKAQLVLFSLGLFCAVSSAADLSDVEQAIIERKYSQARELAQNFVLAGQGTRDEINKARYFLGLSHVYLQNYREARDNFNMIIKDAPQTVLVEKARLGIIDTYNLSGEYEKALDEAEGLLKKSPRSENLSLIYLKISRSHLRLSHWAKAHKYLNKIVTEFPESFESHIAKQLLDEEQYFSVQVGSFLDPDKAKNLVQELQDQHEYAFIVQTSDKAGQTFFRVRIGQFSRLDQAQEMEQKLSRIGYPTRIYP